MGTREEGGSSFLQAETIKGSPEAGLSPVVRKEHSDNEDSGKSKNIYSYISIIFIRETVSVPPVCVCGCGLRHASPVPAARSPGTGPGAGRARFLLLPPGRAAAAGTAAQETGADRTQTGRQEPE